MGLTVTSMCLLEHMIALKLLPYQFVTASLRLIAEVQTWPQQTLLVNVRQSISNAMGVRFARGIGSVSLAFKRRM
jgi:hypothetical protein